MKTEYAVEIYNKHNNDFIKQVDVFTTYEAAADFVENNDLDYDKDSECLGIIEIEYDDNETEVSVTRM